MKSRYYPIWTCLLLGLFLLGGCKSSYKQSTPTELGESLFLTLKNKDHTGYQNLYPTKNDIPEMVEKEGIEAEKAADYTARLEKIMGERQGKIASSFQFLQKQIETAGVNLAESIWEGADVTTRPAKAELQLATVELFFRYGEKQYSIRINDAARLNRGWFINVDPIWIGEATR